MMRITTSIAILLLGLLIGFMACLLLTVSDSLKTAKEWQTLVAALTALFAAFLSLIAINRQTQKNIEASAKNVEAVNNQTQQNLAIEKESRERKAWSKKAKMRGAICEIQDYLRHCFNYIDGRREGRPVLPQTALSVFQDSIEFVDHGSAGKIYRVIQILQVHESRMNGFHQETNLEQRSVYSQDLKFKGRFVDIVYLQFLVDNIFDYADGKDTEIPDDTATGDSMEQSFKSLNHAYAARNELGGIEALIEICRGGFDKNNNLLRQKI